ncbi:MAG TPA: HipA domain-containing protein [Actinomycetes bacterium]|nr:HipA domain-containing protein [Actinomycetes bacterium]
MTDIDVRDVQRATVWKGAVPAGELVRIGEGTSFRYLDAYVASSGRPVAHSLPLDVGEVTAPAGAVPPFFAGLLPEGERLLSLSRRVKTSLDDMMSLLLAVGSDAVGDVRVLPVDADPTIVAPPILDGDLQGLGEADFNALFERSIGVDAGAGDDVALAGVQDKVSASVISFPVTDVAGGGAAILKLNPQRYPGLVENESWCLTLASDAELAVAQHQVVHDRHGKSALLVHRFDRVSVDGVVMSLEQEDAAQLAGRYPGQKYRMRSIEVARAVREVAHSRPLAMRELIALFAASYLMGNGDLHAKNVSVLTSLDGETRLSPAYDLVSTVAYIPDDRMALEFEGRDNRLRRTDFINFGERVGVPAKAVARRLDHVCDVIETYLDRVGDIGLDDAASSRISRTMRERLTRFTLRA